jgi:hypothetical protein
VALVEVPGLPAGTVGVAWDGAVEFAVKKREIAMPKQAINS